MLPLDDVVAYLNALLVVKGQPPDSNGLIVQGRSSVGRIAGCVDLSWSALREAVRSGADLLFSHHAAWKSTDAAAADEKYRYAAESGLSVYVAHDSLDAHSELGTAVCLSEVLGLSVGRVFCDGIGVLAKAEPRPLQSLVDLAKARLSARTEVIATHPSSDQVALIAGWGARPEWIQEAKELGADSFLSGEAIHFGKLYARENDINLILAGHFATEVPAVRAVLARIEMETGIQTNFTEDPGASSLF